jgi:hypothetical protein
MVNRVAVNNPAVSDLDASVIAYICASGEYSTLSVDEFRHEERSNKVTTSTDAKGKYLDIICFKNIVHQV